MSLSLSFIECIEWEAEFVLRFKFKWLKWRIKNGFIEKYKYKKLAMNYYVDYLVILMNYKIISFNAACNLFDEFSQKIQTL